MAMPSPATITADERLRVALRIAGLSVRTTYSVPEVARMLSVGNSTIYRWMDWGELKYIRPGNRHSRRIDYGALMALFEEREDE